MNIADYASSYTDRMHIEIVQHVLNHLILVNYIDVYKAIIHISEIMLGIVVYCKINDKHTNILW